MSLNARSAILNRIRTTLGNREAPCEAAYAALVRDYIHRGQMKEDARLALMIERLHEYDAKVVECAPDAVRKTIHAQIVENGYRKLLVPAGFPKEWLPDDIPWLIDGALSDAQIEEAEGIITAAFCAIADSGTIALHHSESEGRRVLTLLPDWHLCVLKASQVVETLPEYFARCAAPPRLATYFSGPSATADIEMTRIKGVHGPRFLTVVLVHD
jgi:L-lactate dehydrogenase complex protein LldG